MPKPKPINVGSVVVLKGQGVPMTVLRSFETEPPQLEVCHFDTYETLQKNTVPKDAAELK